MLQKLVNLSMEKMEEITADMIEDVSVHLPNNVDIAITFICRGEHERNLLYVALGSAELGLFISPQDFLLVLIKFKDRIVPAESKRIKISDLVLQYLTDDGTGKTYKPVITFCAYKSNEAIMEYSQEISVAVRPLRT
jgi:hypothetical protein